MGKCMFPAHYLWFPCFPCMAGLFAIIERKHRILSTFTHHVNVSWLVCTAGRASLGWIMTSRCSACRSLMLNQSPSSSRAAVHSIASCEQIGLLATATSRLALLVLIYLLHGSDLERWLPCLMLG